MMESIWSKEKHFKEALETIVDIGCDLDGYNPNSAKQMRGLVDELVNLATQSLKLKPIYLDHKGNPAYKVESKIRRRNSR